MFRFLGQFKEEESIKDKLLDKANQNLTAVPSYQPYLEFIYLQGNEIEILPDDFFPSLPNLKWLDLRDNKLLEIPTTIKDHDCLATLLLSNNKLKKLPVELASVKKLKTVHLANNDITFPCQAVIEMGTAATLNFLHNKYVEREFGDGVCSEKSFEVDAVAVKAAKKFDESISVSQYSLQSVRSVKKCPKLEKARARFVTNTSRYLKPCRVGNKEACLRKIREANMNQLTLKKCKEVLAAKEKILQKRLQADNLQSWRQKYRFDQRWVRKTYELDPERLPFGVDANYLRFQSRRDIQKDLPDKHRKRLFRRGARPAIPNTYIKGDELIFGDLKKLLRELESVATDETGDETPGAEKMNILKEMEKIEKIREKLSQLSLQNAVSVITLE